MPLACRHAIVSLRRQIGPRTTALVRKSRRRRTLTVSDDAITLTIVAAVVMLFL
jgi:hypothetical protein